MDEPVARSPVSVSKALKVVRLHIGAGRSVPEHHANVDVVVTVVHGTGRFTIDGTEREIAPGDVIVMAPRTPHAIIAATDLELVVVHARLATDGEAAGRGHN